LRAVEGSEHDEDDENESDERRSIEMDKTFQTSGPVRLFVQNEVGHVVIDAGPTATTTVTLEPETAAAEELVSRAVVECRPSGARHVVTVKVPKLHGMRFVRRNAVTVRVEVPEGSDVAVMAGSADVDVTGPIGAADISTASGDVTTDDVAADVKAKSASGDITVGNVGGELKVATASGDLRCSSVTGPTVFSTATGDLEVGMAGSRLEVKATSGNVRLGELSHGARIANVSGDVRILLIDEGALHVRSVSGHVSVGVGRGVDLHVDVETLSGTVNSEIPLDSKPGTIRRDARVDVSVRSVSGNVEIVRALEDVA
jgi:DUF4097 and DUF4098 domain-containing protein YvlB